MKKILLFILLSGVALAQYTSQYKGSQIDSAVTAARAMYLGTASTVTEPDGSDYLLYYNSDSSYVTKVAMSDLPVPSSVSTALSSYVTNTVFDDTVDYFLNEIRRLELMIQEGIPRDTTINPYNVLALSSTNTASHTTGTITLTWTPPVCEFDSTRVYYSTNGTDFSYLASVDSGTNTYAHSSISPRYNAPYYYYVRPVLDGVESNLDTITNYRYDELVVSDFITKNWYVSTTNAGDSTGTSWANAKRLPSAYSIFATSAEDGDTVYIDGGADSLIYDDYMSGRAYVMSLNYVDGSSANPIIITRGIDASHNGIPIFRATRDSVGTYGVASGSNCIKVWNSSNFEISYLRVDTAFSTHPSLSQQWASIAIDASNNFTLAYNTIYHPLTTGLKLSSSDNITITNNSFLTGDIDNIYCNDAINWAGGTSAEVSYNEFISQNKQASTSETINHNDIIQASAIYDGDFSIHHNFFSFQPSTAPGYSMGLQFEQNIRGDWDIYNNVFVWTGVGSNSSYGKFGKNDVGSVPLNINMYNNTFYTDANTVLELGGTPTTATIDNLVFKNNVMYNPDGNAFSITNANYTAMTGTFDYNQFYVDTANVFVLGGSSYPGQAEFVAKYPQDSTDFESVSFNQAGSDYAIDYMLASASSGVEEGVDLSAYFTDDYLGSTRPISSRWDVGAFETGTNIITNGLFTSNITGWTGGASTPIHYNSDWNAIGRTNVLLDSATTTANVRFWDEITLDSAATYVLRFDYYIPSANTTTEGIRLRLGGTLAFIGTTYKVQNAWTTVILEFTTTDSENEIIFYQTEANGTYGSGITSGDKIYIDNVYIYGIP